MRVIVVAAVCVAWSSEAIVEDCVPVQAPPASQASLRGSEEESMLLSVVCAVVKVAKKLVMSVLC